MKHLKLFENFNDIDSICKKYGITNYTINSDGTVDVDDDVNLFNKLTKLPLKFGKVTGYFTCGDNQLTSLEGSPREVGGHFECGNNKLRSLEGGPMEVGGNFDCSHNQLTSLKGIPMVINGNFFCNGNQLTSLVGGPTEVGSNFYCSNNQLTSLEGGPRELGSHLYCSVNPIHTIYRLFDNNYKKYQDSLDYNYLRGLDIIKSRFKEALQEIGKKLPDEINDYRYI